MAALSLGIAIGAGHLTGAPHPGPATRWTTQLTIAPHVAPEAGLPEENPRVRPDGVVVTGFVERVGDPVPIAGPGGQSFAAEQLTVDAVRSLVKSQLAAFDGPPPLVIACPAYWPESARERFAAAAADARLPQPLRIETDLTMAFARLRQLPDLPRTGLIALADLGATGTTVAIGDAATGKLVGERIRLDEPNGTDLDHALLQHLLGQVAEPDDLASSDPNLVAALEQLRISVRAAKERLSEDPVTSVHVDLPMYRGEMRITRAELDDLAGDSIGAITTGLRELVDRGGAGPSDLVGIALCGGGAAMPLVTQRLSSDFHSPVFVDDDPSATAARGAAGIASTMAAPRAQRPVGVAGPTGQGGPPAGRSGPIPAGSGPVDRDRRGGPNTGPNRGPNTGPNRGPNTGPNPGRRTAAAGGAAAGAAAAAAGAAAAAQGATGDSIPTPPTGTPAVSDPANSARWNAQPNAAQSADVPVGPRGHGNAVTFAPRDDPGPVEPKRSKARLFLFVAAGAVMFLLAAGGVAVALTGNNQPSTPSPGTSVSQFTTKSTTSSSVEPTTEFTPAPQPWVPDPNCCPSTTEPSSQWSESVPSSVDTGGTPSVTPPVTGGGGTDGGGSGGNNGGGGGTTPIPTT